MKRIAAIGILLLGLVISSLAAAQAIGEVRLNDGRTFAIARFTANESAANYYIRSGKQYFALADLREVVRIDSGLSHSRHYQITLANGDWRDFSSNVFLFRRVVYRNSHGDWAESFIPVLKDRGSNGFRFMAVTGAMTDDHYVEIANPGEISEIRIFTPPRYAVEEGDEGVRDASLRLGTGE